MPTPKNKKLYNQIKQKIRRSLDKQGKRWSAYASGRLVSEYKRKGGTYSGDYNDTTGIGRWFREEWIDVCYWPKRVKCGRDKDRKNFPYCRPSHRVNSKTPKTVQSLSASQRKKLCAKKRSNPKRRVLSMNNQKIVLQEVVKSPKSEKKWRAIFQIGNRTIRRDFGQKGAEDYTMHHDKERRNRYITRHTKDLSTNDPTRAGYLSMYVLWNKPSFHTSLADYKKRLNIYNKTGNFPKKYK